MSDHDKIFAKFPGKSEGEYFLIDIMTIESIGQSDEPRAAVIFTNARFYQAVVRQEDLDEAQMPDAASLCYAILAEAAVNAAAAPETGPTPE